MFFKAIQTWMGGGSGSIPGVASEAEFAVALRRERDRADRTHDGLSLVAAELARPALGEGKYRRTLGRMLEGRLRSTDAAGWLPDGRLGLVLPHTPEEGAWALVDDLKHALTEEAGAHPLPSFSVYTYQGGDGGSEDDLGTHEDPLHRPSPAAALPAEPRSPEPRGKRLAGVRLSRTSLELEPLLFRPPSRTKRALDVLLAGVGLVLSAPVLLLAAVAIKATSRGPVLFRQTRAGYGGRPFTFYKLRTMVEGAEELKAELAAFNEIQDGPAFKISGDPRVTGVGRILRKTSIDELPQLWNVLRGDMSIVGPRPPTLDEVQRYASWQRRRLHGIGGLTCIWQVSGRSDIGFLDWMRLDLRYMQQRSTLRDLLLILRTIPAVLVGRGAK